MPDEMMRECAPPVPNPSVRPGARRDPVDEALIFMRANRDTHRRWAEFFEQNHDVEKKYLRAGVWEWTSDQRRLERQYSAAIATVEALAASTRHPPASLMSEENVERVRLKIGNAGKSFVNTLGYCMYRGMLAVDPDTTMEQAEELLREAARAAISSIQSEPHSGEG